MAYKTIFKKNHYFQIVHPSFIPITLSFIILFIAYNLIIMLHTNTSYWNSITIKFNILLLIIILNWWFAFMRVESNYLFVYTKEVEKNILMGMLLFITSEVFLFASIFWAFFHASLSPSIFVGSTWPPIGIQSISPWKIPFLNTITLLISGVTVNCYYYSLKALSFSTIKNFPANNYFFKSQKNSFYYQPFNLNTFYIKTAFLNIISYWKRIYKYLFITIALGSFFLIVQLFEYINTSFSLSDGIYGSVFYSSTGLHGCHVLLGLLMLISCFIRKVAGDFDTKQTIHLSCTCTVWYWHFVDVVWLFCAPLWIIYNSKFKLFLKF